LSGWEELKPVKVNNAELLGVYTNAVAVPEVTVLSVDYTRITSVNTYIKYMSFNSVDGFEINGEVIS